MDKSWLIRQITDRELQNLNGICQIETDGIQIWYEKDPYESESEIEQFSMPGTGLHVSVEYLQCIRSEMSEGDQLWIFKSPPESWKYLAGRAGLCVLRDEKIIESYLLVLN